MNKISVIILASLMVFVLAGCGGEKNAVNSVTDNNVNTGSNESTNSTAEIEAVEKTDKQTDNVINEEDLKKVVSDFYNLIVQKDSTTIARFISEQHLKLRNETKEEFAKGFYQNRNGDAVEVKSFEITQFSKYDDTHYYVIVSTEAVVNGQAMNGQDEWMLVKESNEWKMDGTLLVKSTPLKTQVDNPIYLVGQNFILNEQVNGLSIDFKMINNSDYDIIFGTNKGLSKATLVTDEGVFYTSFDDQFVLPVKADAQMTIPFIGAKGTPQYFAFDEMYAEYNVDEKGDPKPDGGKLRSETFYFGELTSARLRSIGREVFTVLANIEIAKNEDEANNLFKQTLGGTESELVKSIKSGIEYGKYKNIEVSFSSEEAQYDKTFHVIRYNASPKIKLTDHDGKETINELRIASEIIFEPKDGTFSYMFIQFK